MHPALVVKEVAVVESRVLPPRARGLRHLILLVFAVTGILVGLLAMHTVISSPDGHAVSHSAVATGHHADPGPFVADSHSNMQHSSLGCAGTCDPGHNMSTMVCLLALLVATLLLILHVALTRWSDRSRLLGAALMAVLSAALAPPSPPSLHALCISRT
ncbi:hypothetical protein DOE76_07695 [Leifsonia sp. ku-ls]|nr:hypothetical protein DOE76_07695 [Leifsonia sp. ku-ls]